MTTPSELVECRNCQSWFTDTSLDDLFFHGTTACRQLAAVEAELSHVSRGSRHPSATVR